MALVQCGATDRSEYRKAAGAAARASLEAGIYFPVAVLAKAHREAKEGSSWQKSMRN
jgi:hypothetical protein